MSNRRIANCCVECDNCGEMSDTLAHTKLSARRAAYDEGWCVGAAMDLCPPCFKACVSENPRIRRYRRLT